MRNRLSLILASTFLFSVANVGAATSSTDSKTQQVTADDSATFKRSMENAIEEQKKKIQALKSVVFNLKAPVEPGAGDRLIQETLMFEVKEALYKNFINSPVSQDPDFQTHLLKIMNKNNITESDLKELQQAATEANGRLKK